MSACCLEPTHNTRSRVAFKANKVIIIHISFISEEETNHETVGDPISVKISSFQLLFTTQVGFSNHQMR